MLSMRCPLCKFSCLACAPRPHSDSVFPLSPHSVPPPVWMQRRGRLGRSCFLLAFRKLIQRLYAWRTERLSISSKCKYGGASPIWPLFKDLNSCFRLPPGSGISVNLSRESLYTPTLTERLGDSQWRVLQGADAALFPCLVPECLKTVCCVHTGRPYFTVSWTVSD